MSASFERVAVIGLGLLGGSVALAAKRSGVARRVVGVGRRRPPLERALAQGVVDEIGEPSSAVRGADLVVLATPVGSMSAVVQSLAPSLSEGALVTDVGSVKEMLADSLAGLLPRGVHYVGAHPMAGSHLRGVGHARADLFDGAACAICPTAGSDSEAVARVEGFWRSLGARVVLRDPTGHDRDVAWTSHVPHTLAFAFASALGSATPEAGELAGGGFRDFTRIAQSDAELWGDILCANRKALSAPLQRCSDELSALARAIESGDAERVENFLAAARETLAAVSSARSGGVNPEIQTASPSADVREGKSKGRH